MGIRPNGHWTKWALDQMDVRPNGCQTKCVLNEQICIGPRRYRPNGFRPTDLDQMGIRTNRFGPTGNKPFHSGCIGLKWCFFIPLYKDNL